VDARFLSSHTAGTFTGCTIGPYATASGKNSENQALFKWFEYEGKDPEFED
jgi:xylan 1,4-beta-xylosidase